MGGIRQIEYASGLAEIEAAARRFNVALEVVDIRSADAFEAAFDAMTRKQVGAVIFLAGPLAFGRRQEIADLALKHHLPAIHLLKEYAEAGLLVTNGPNLADILVVSTIFRTFVGGSLI